MRVGILVFFVMLNALILGATEQKNVFAKKNLISSKNILHSPAHCVALVYHHFSDNAPKSTRISPALFEQHLSYLKANQFQVLPLLEVVYKLKNNQPLADKCVVLTADDAYLSIYENAYPLIKKFNMPIAIFVTTDAIDKKYSAMMSWDKMREMKGDLVTFYNHSRTHAHLPSLKKNEIYEQITYAQNRLESQLGVSNKLFAYPYGEFDEKTYKILSNLGYTAFGQQSGAMGSDSDFLALPRFSMAGKYGQMKSFTLKVQTLAMPITAAYPISQMIKKDQNPPILRLYFKRNLSQDEQVKFSCFISNNKKPLINWLNDRTVQVRADTPLNFGRTRYNCTFSSGQKGRFYWFSKQWFNRNKNH